MLTGAAVTALTRTSVCALGRHHRGPRTPSGASSSHIGRSEERSHPRLHRLPIDDQAAIARSSGLMTSSSPPPLRSLREIVPLPTINHKAARAGFLQSLDVAQSAALTACAAMGRIGQFAPRRVRTPRSRCKPANGGQRLTPAVTGWLLATANLQAVSPTQLPPDEHLGRPWLGWAVVVLLFIVLVIGVVLWLATGNLQFG